MIHNNVTVVIPTIPGRYTFLHQALESVWTQSLSVEAVAVVKDVNREGAARNRQRGLDMVRTEWVAFLDDDDLFLPEHIEKLLGCALEEEADFVFSWYEVRGGTDPRPEEFGVAWDSEHPRQTTITTLVRTELAQSVGFVHPEETTESLMSPDRHWAGEDWFFTKGCNDAGAKIVHLPERTWVWRHHSKNTSGLPSRW